MRALFYIQSIIFILFLFSCKVKDDSVEPNYYAAKFVAELNPTDTFVYEFYKDKRLPDSFFLKIKRRDESHLKLQSLEKGYDSIQIRIWYGCSIGIKRLIILENSNSKWQAEISKLEYYTDSITGQVNSMARSIISKSPKSGWQKFISQLFELRILTLPNENEIPNFKEESVNDGCGATIEIATRNAYRFYGYENPDLHSYWETKNMILILKLINKEFEIKGKWEWPPEHQDTTKTDTKPLIIKEIELQDIKQDSTKH